VIHVITGHICSGKSTYVKQHAKRGDVVIDLDRIAAALGPEDSQLHDCPEAVRQLATFVRASAIDDAIRLARQGRIANLWIVHAYPSDQDIVRYRRLGATIRELSVDEETLTSRAAAERPLAAQLELRRRLSMAASRRPPGPRQGPWTGPERLPN
jgi:hypothetical protein